MYWQIGRKPNNSERVVEADNRSSPATDTRVVMGTGDEVRTEIGRTQRVFVL